MRDGVCVAACEQLGWGFGLVYALHLDCPLVASVLVVAERWRLLSHVPGGVEISHVDA